MITFDDATEAVEEMEVNMSYFHTVSPGARMKIAKQLMAIVNWPRERILKNGLGEVIPYVEPKARLAWLIQQIMQCSSWPGMSQVRGRYCLRFPPADGISAECDRSLWGVGEDGRFVSDAIGIEAAPEPEYEPQEGDEPIGDELRAQLAGAAKKLGGGK